MKEMIEATKRQAEERMERLFQLLFKQDRLEDAKRAAADREFREQLMVELGV